MACLLTSTAQLQSATYPHTALSPEQRNGGQNQKGKKAAEFLGWDKDSLNRDSKIHTHTTKPNQIIHPFTTSHGQAGVHPQESWAPSLGKINPLHVCVPCPSFVSPPFPKLAMNHIVWNTLGPARISHPGCVPSEILKHCQPLTARVVRGAEKGLVVQTLLSNH